MSKDNGGPAFPNKAEQCNFGYELSGGMTLRDYFAAKAMQGLIVQSKFLYGMDQEHWTKQAAGSAYLAADAMLKARAT